jgi:DNA-binding GntR family transcriptional regulator
MDAPQTNPPGSAAVQTSYMRVRDLIRADIVEGRIPSESRLKIDEIARRYETSAIPVREALQQLQGEGVVVFTANRGARARKIDEAFLRNIFEIRALLEPYLVRWFVRHHTEAMLDALADVQTVYDASLNTDDPETWHAHNLRFHAILYDGHYNDEAVATSKRHNDLLHSLARRLPASRARGSQVSREHWAIVEMARLHNEDAAAAILAEHVRHAGIDLIERMLAAQKRQPPTAFARPVSADPSTGR